MIIPVALFFDQNYVIPASVAIYSLLMNSNPEHEYHIHVFFNGISQEDISKLESTCQPFPNSRFFSQDMKGRFTDIFERTKLKAHYSKEMYYKFLVPTLLPQHKKAIVSDVDVVFLGDVSSTFLNAVQEEDTLIAGCVTPFPQDSWVAKYKDQYRKNFTEEEIGKLVVGGGYYVFNLDAMRREETEKELVRFAMDNLHRVKQPEQDVISLVCSPRIEVLPLENMVCSYCYDLLVDEDSFGNVAGQSPEDVKHALENPIQLHYATWKKPWNALTCTKSEIWHQYLFRTPFSEAYLRELEARLCPNTRWQMRLPLRRGKKLAILLMRGLRRRFER